jgi:hypothetical protein
MKRLKYALIGLSALVALAACGNFDELNTDPNRTLLSETNPGSLLNPALYGVAAAGWDYYHGFTSALMQIVVSTNSTSGAGWYDVNDSAGNGSWNTFYRWLNTYTLIEQTAVELNEPNYRAIALTMRSLLFQILCDEFGNIPMSEACKADELIFTPKFDDQKAVYRQILADLEKANSLFDTAAGLRYNPSGELLYGAGTASAATTAALTKWKKFANSLRLRVLTRVSGVSEFDAAAEIGKILDDPATWPIFESNADAALLHVTGAAPLVSPMTRPQDFGSYKSYSEFFIDHLNSWNDPRLPLFANTATNDKVTGYFGIPSGYETMPGINGSGLDQQICIEPMDLCLMSYAEVEFIKAEMAQRGIVSLDAGEAYEKGVTAAIEQWGLALPAGYFSNPAAAWDGTLERIMLQKFFALFFCDYQQWFEYNRTGLPAIPRGAGVPANRQMPRRFKYPAALQRTNLQNYQAAREAMGGDETSVKLFWQQ